MLRTALRPYWLGLLALALVIAGLMTWAGFWQLGVAQSAAQVEAVGQARSQPVVPIDEVLEPHSPFPAAAGARRVVVQGRYAAGGQVLVGPRRLDGRPGWWVVTPLVERGSGVMIPVVRGFVQKPVQMSLPPQEVASVTMGLAPGESPSEGSVASGRMGSVDLAQFVNATTGEIYNAFGFAISETSASGTPLPAPLATQRVPPPLPETGLRLRNAAYAVQWWVFALFVLYIWWRMVRDAVQDERDDPQAMGAPPEPDPRTIDAPVDAGTRPATPADPQHDAAHGIPEEIAR